MSFLNRRADVKAGVSVAVYRVLSDNCSTGVWAGADLINVSAPPSSLSDWQSRNRKIIITSFTKKSRWVSHGWSVSHLLLILKLKLKLILPCDELICKLVVVMTLYNKGWFTLATVVCVFRSGLCQHRDRKIPIALRKRNCPLQKPYLCELVLSMISLLKIGNLSSICSRYLCNCHLPVKNEPS